MNKIANRAAWLAWAPLCLAAAPAPQPAIDTNSFNAQVVLDRLGFSPGVIDGRPGKSLTAAIKGFQQARGLDATGTLDAPTLAALKAAGEVPAVASVTLTEDMLAGPFIDPLPRSMAAQAKLPTIAYRTRMEKLGEMFHTTPDTLVALNTPQTPLTPGTQINVPNVVATAHDYKPELKPEWRQTLAMLNIASNQPQAARIVVDKSDGVLRVFDDADTLVAQFPATMGSRHDPLPIGTWKILGVDTNPKFHYNPKLFWDARKGDSPATLPPGPNGPVGVIWIDLSKPHYGIHGTPEPSTIGRAESHGCIRLTNWDAARLSLMVKPGTPALFQK